VAFAYRSIVRHAINLPFFGPLADPGAALEIALAAEEAGFDGLFAWDHVLAPVEGSWDIADPWVLLSGIAARTSRIRIGTMVTPLPRRRIAKLAREAVTLDRLSLGRLTLGLGAGGDGGRELSAFGESGDPKVLGDILDEGADLLVRLWRGESVQHRGHLVVDNVAMTPPPFDGRHIPIWIGCQGFRVTSASRAARFDGIFPMDVDDEAVDRILAVVERARGSLDGFDLALAVHPKVDLQWIETRGAAWAMHSFWPGHRPDQILRFIARGRPT
jgi:alkanesulfonate monooxygenase SsuD/methylene tetrahydromethanopterin reductase-like flavin-dependent oxidoreductase (luciferase family)